MTSRTEGHAVLAMGRSRANYFTAVCFFQRNSDAVESVTTVSPPYPLFALLSLPGRLDSYRQRYPNLFQKLAGHQRPTRVRLGYLFLLPPCHRSLSLGSDGSDVSSSYLGLGPGGGNSLLPSLISLQISLSVMPSVPGSPLHESCQVFLFPFRRGGQGPGLPILPRPNSSLPKSTPQRGWKSGWTDLELHGDPRCCFCSRLMGWGGRVCMCSGRCAVGGQLLWPCVLPVHSLH